MKKKKKIGFSSIICVPQVFIQLHNGDLGIGDCLCKFPNDFGWLGVGCHVRPSSSNPWAANTEVHLAALISYHQYDSIPKVVLLKISVVCPSIVTGRLDELTIMPRKSNEEASWAYVVVHPITQLVWDGNILVGIITDETW